MLGIEPARVEPLASAVYHQGVGLCRSCTGNPLVKEALARLGVEPARADFRSEMRDFVAMSLAWYGRG